MPWFWRDILKNRIDQALFPFMGKADIAVILGSGLSVPEESVTPVESVSYKDIPGFVVPSVEGHPGRLLLLDGGCSGILLFAGRVHLYEGCNESGEQNVPGEHDGIDPGGRNYNSKNPEIMVALAARLGCKRLLLTQAAGSLDPVLQTGTWMLADDIVSLPQRIFRGSMPPGGFSAGTVHAGEISTGAPPVFWPGSLLSEGFRGEIALAALGSKVPIRDGILFWTPGPNYETPAEAMMARSMGANAATMSPMPELLEAKRQGIEAACLSWITNFAPNVSRSGTDHSRVIGMGRRGSRMLLKIIMELSRCTNPGGAITVDHARL